MNYCPCKDYIKPKRHVGCHSDCKKYIGWRRDFDIKKTIIVNEKTKEMNIQQYEIDRVRRYKGKVKK